jgi:hypothetical protein
VVAAGLVFSCEIGKAVESGTGGLIDFIITGVAEVGITLWPISLQ